MSALIFVLLSSLNAQWQTLNQGRPFGLGSIDFANEETGWILGNNNIFLKTINAGTTWNELQINENWNIYNFDFINDTLGYASGFDTAINKNILIKTNDGGISWYLLKEIADTFITAIYPVNENTVFAILGKNTFIRSSNGGLNWTKSPEFSENISIQNIWFFNADKGIVAGGYGTEPYDGIIYKTYDGGNSWRAKKLPGIREIRSLKFINDSTGYFLAFNENYLTLFCETKDTANTWQIKSANEIYFTDYSFSSEDTVYAIAAGLIVIAMNNGIVRSTDSGISWEKVESISDWYYSSIFFNENHRGFLAGAFLGRNGGSLLLTTKNGGISWSNSILTYPFLSAHFIDQYIGFAVGGETEIHFQAGNIFKTNDGGKTWKTNFNPGKQIKKCLFIDDSIGYAISNSWVEESNLFKTDDGALNWYAVADLGSGETPFTIRDIYYDNTNLWIAGKILTLPQYRSVIYKSPDKGKSWIKSWENPNHETFVFNSLHFTDSNTGWAVGEKGLMMKYTSPEWNVIPTVTDLPLYNVYFVNENTGWITGGFYNYNHSHKFLWKKTSDGGSNWTDVNIGDYFIEDIEFKNANLGWAVGFDSLAKGIILGTVNGGNSWTVQMNQLEAPLHDLHYKDGFVWAVGSLGLVLKSDGTSWIKPNKNHYSNDFQLYQNFPNPFNPVTKIQFYLPQTSQVKIDVYNSAGQRVATLLNRKMVSGTHSVEFVANHLASGIYIYRISAGIFNDAKKMILIK